MSKDKKQQTNTISIPPGMPLGCSICGGSGKQCGICGEGPSTCGCDPDEVDEYTEKYGDQFSPCESCQE